MSVGENVGDKPHKKPKRGARSGLRVLKTLVAMRGLRGINRNTIAGRMLVEWKDTLVGALGGPEQVSPQRLVLIDAIIRTRLYIDCLDMFLLKQRSLVDKTKKAVLPVVRERQGLVDSLSRLLGQLGLDRVELDGGMLPASWVEKVRPYQEDQTGEGGDAAATATPGDGAAEANGGAGREET